MNQYFNKKYIKVISFFLFTLSTFISPFITDAAVTQVQQIAAGNAAATTVAATWPAGTTAGNLLVAVVAFRGGSGVTVTPPTVSPAWTLAIRTDNSTTLSTAIYYIASSTSQSGASTWTLSAAQNATLSLAEYSNVLKTSPLDKTATSTGVGTTGMSGTTTVTAQANEVAIAGISINHSNKTLTSWTNSFVETNQISSTGGAQTSRNKTGMAYKVLSATGAQSTAVTISASQSWAGAIATFKEAVNTAPNPPTLVSPANGSYTNDNTPTLSANFSDPDTGNTGITNYRIATSSTNCTSGIVVASGSSATTTSNNQNTTWTPATSIGSDATYYWCARNSDGAATSAWTSMGNFILDTVAPTLSISSPSTSLTKSGPVTYTVTYSGADSVTLANGNITLNTTGTATGTVAVTGTGTTTRTVTISSIIGDGTLGISIVAGTASDTAGNTALATGPSTIFTVDNTNPTSTITSPVDGSFIASTTVNLIGTSSDTHLASTTISIDGGAFVATNGTAASWTYSATGLTRSTHTFQSRAVDTLGNIGFSATTTVTLTKEEQAALTAIATPSTVGYGATSTLSSTGGTGTGGVTFSAGVSTGCSIIGTDLYVTDASGNCFVTATKAADTNYNATTSPAITVTLIPKSITVTAHAKSKQFGEADPAFTYTSSDLGAIFTGNLSRVAGEAPGIYAITIGDLSAGSNYSITFVSANLTIYAALTPTTTSISPTSKIVGDSDFILTVNGTNFTSSSTINFNGSARSTIYSSSTELTATILSTDLLIATNTVQITVTDIGGTSNAQTFTVNNPVPTITSIYPTSKNIGDPQFTLTISGTNFVSNSIVRVNGGDRATTYYSSSTVLTAIIPASDLLASTTLDITVFNASPGGGTSNTQYLTVSPGVVIPTKFVITQATDGTIDVPSQVTIQAQNASGVLAETYQRDVTLVASGSATGGGLVNIVNGIGTTTISDETIETVTLSLLDSEVTGLNVSSTADVHFGPGATAKLSITGSTTEMIAGTRLPLIVYRYDRLDNAITAGSETFYLTSNSLSPAKKFYDASSDGNIVTSVLIPDASSHATVWYYDEKTGAPQITVSDNMGGPDGATGIDDDSIGVTVRSAAASAFFISNPGDLFAGQRLAYELSRQDQFGNSSDNGTSTAYLYSDSVSTSSAFYDAATNGNIIDSVAMSPGISTSSFWFYGEKVGSISVTVSDNSSAPDGTDGINDASDSFAISPGSVGIFALNEPGNMTVNTRLGYTVSRFDNYNNAINSGDTTVYLYHNAPGTSTVFYDAATNGSEIHSLIISEGAYNSSFWLYSNDAGNYTVTVSDNSSSPDGNDGINDAGDSISVSIVPITASRFVILDHVPSTVGVTTAITIQAQDGAGNLDTTYNGSVTLNASGDSTPGGIVSIVNGVGTINIIDTKAETVTLTLTDSAGTGFNVSSTKDIDFLSGPTKSFTMTGSGTSVAGDRVAFNITRKDQYNNPVTAGVDTVYLYSNATAGTYHFYSAASGGSQILYTSILNGSDSADVWFAGTKAGTWTLDSSDNSVTSDGAAGIIDGTAPLIVSPSVTARLTLNNPGDMFNSTRLGYTGTRYDAYDNLVTAGSENYYLYSNAVSTSTAFYNVSTGGSPVTTINFADGLSTASFWYYEAQNGIWTVYLSDNSSAHDGDTGIVDGEDAVTVSVVPIVATKFIIVPSNNTSQVGTAITVDVRAVNNNDDIDTTYQNDVTLSVSGMATGGGLVNIVNGVGQVSINDTVAETVNLSLQDTQFTGLNVSSVQSLTFSATTVISSGGGTVASAVSKPVVFFTGRAFPLANLQIMAIQNGQVPVGSMATGYSSGTFNAAFNDLLPSIIDYFALVVYDKDRHIAQTKIFKLGENDSLYASILMAPTVSLKQETVTRGTFLGLIGSAMPNYKIELMIDGVKAPETVSASGDGNYDLIFNTYRLAVGEHTLRVRQVDSQGTASDYSIEKKFKITASFMPKADINGDGKVDIQDWSLFISLYRSTDTAIRSKVDLNNDGFVDSKDLSLFLQSLNY